MSRFVAALPMYDWPELRASVDARWRRLRARLLEAGIEAPAELARRNADLPPVTGGIRDVQGRVIAPDPATLPADDLDLATLWRHPGLLLSEACWGPLEAGLAAHVEVVAQRDYAGIEGGQGVFYSSALLMRREGSMAADDAADGPGWVGASAPAHGGPLIPLVLLRGRRLAYNAPDSMSGMLALSRDLRTLGESDAMFAEAVETGSHRASIVAVAGGRADVCSVDCLSWQIARQHEPAATALRVVGWTSRRRGLPMIASRHHSMAVLGQLRTVLSSG